MRLKSFVRSFAALTFVLLFLMGALARPVLAQSEDAASSPDSKQPTLQLSGPLERNFSVSYARD